MLSVGSAVFDAMFNSTLATSEEEIPLPDVEPASFLALLKFLYSDEVQIGPETVMTTLYTAKKYAVPALEKHCVDFLKRHLCADNAFMLLTQVSNSLGTNSSMFANCSVFCDVLHVRSSILGQNVMFGKFDVQTFNVRSVRSSVFWCSFQDYGYVALLLHFTSSEQAHNCKFCISLQVM